MCGIAGAFSKKMIKTGVLSKIIHRGPDAQQAYSRQKIWLGHTRLAILDLSEAGAQPMMSQDGRWVIVFNGEIYNHLDIRSELRGRIPEISFRGHSDTETLIESISFWGVEETIEKLNGMFAFAVWDQQDQKLHLIRDPFGIKPLYYIHQEKEIFFASEVKVLEEMGFDLAPKKEGLETLLTLGFTPSPQTLFSNILRLSPGHHLIFSNGVLQENCYIKPQRMTIGSPKDVVLEQYQRYLSSAVKRQMISDVPVGVFLSGGVDSALVAAMARDAALEKGVDVPIAFTVGFESNSQACEIDDAAETARILGLPHKSIQVNTEKLWQNFSKIVDHLEEPVASPSALALWDLVHFAKKDVTVVLAGQGSDEPWGGYRRYQLELYRGLLPNSLWRKGRYLSLFDDVSNKIQIPYWAQRAIASVSVEEQSKRFLESYSIFDSKLKNQFLGSYSDNAYAHSCIEKWLKWLDMKHLHPTEQMMRIDTRMQLADDFLIYGDKISMASSLEMRVPMLDIQLVSFIESIPLKFRVGRRKTKILHKLLAEKFLPSEIVERPKKGFYVPISDWARTIWKERLENKIFSKSEAMHFEFLHRDTVTSFWTNLQENKQNNDRQTFIFLMLIFWFEWLEKRS
jgi:asparagine synthase (glutamine-hydrolysing)